MRDTQGAERRGPGDDGEGGPVARGVSLSEIPSPALRRAEPARRDRARPRDEARLHRSRRAHSHGRCFGPRPHPPAHAPAQSTRWGSPTFSSRTISRRRSTSATGWPSCTSGRIVELATRDELSPARIIPIRRPCLPPCRFPTPGRASPSTCRRGRSPAPSIRPPAAISTRAAPTPCQRARCPGPP